MTQTFVLEKWYLAILGYVVCFAIAGYLGYSVRNLCLAAKAWKSHFPFARRMALYQFVWIAVSAIALSFFVNQLFNRAWAIELTAENVRLIHVWPVPNRTLRRDDIQNVKLNQGRKKVALLVIVTEKNEFRTVTVINRGQVNDAFNALQNAIGLKGIEVTK